MNGSNQNHILPKDSEITLAHSDKFSLLPNEFEYEIKIVRDEIEHNENLAGIADVAPPVIEKAQEMRVRNILEINDRLEAGNMPTSLSQINEDNQTTNNNQTAVEPVIQDEVPEPPHPNSPGTSLAKPSTPATRKRSVSEHSNEGESSKKLKPSPPLLQPNTAESPDETPSSTTNIVPQEQDADKRSESQSAPSPVEGETAKVQIKPDPDSTTPVASSSNVAISAPNIKPDPEAPAVSCKTENDAATDNAPNQRNDQSANSSLRPSCQFGVRCYRVTQEHRNEFAHPSDADYRRPNFPPPAADAPPCPFGAACYRRNPSHFQDFRHPPSS